MYLKQGNYTLFFPPTSNFTLTNSGGEIWIYREWRVKQKQCNVNIVYAGEYNSETPFKAKRNGDITKGGFNISVDIPERFRFKNFVINYRNDIGNTPARINTMTSPAIIEVSDKWKAYPPQVRLFVLLHEMGHMFYQTEDKCDNFALKLYLQQGFNASQAFYALSKILHPEGEGLHRIQKLFSTLKYNNYVSN
jgi:hypothetical protein